MYLQVKNVLVSFSLSVSKDLNLFSLVNKSLPLLENEAADEPKTLGSEKPCFLLLDEYN